jgi:CRISPR-associated protein Cas5t
MIFRLDAPLAGFRPYEARDYQETLPLPPHSTIFGCLLSILGVEPAAAGDYVGTRLGVAGQTGERSVVLRKMRRDPAKPKAGKLRVPAFRPEYQELLSDVVLWIWVERGNAERDLAGELVDALAHPERIARHGVVSVGESCFMLETIAVCSAAPNDALVMRPSSDGSLSLTVWVDFVDRMRTRAARFDLVHGSLAATDTVAIGP